MPFKSQAQRAYMFIHHPEIAKEFQAHTPIGAKLPYHVKKKSKKVDKYHDSRGKEKI